MIRTLARPSRRNPVAATTSSTLPFAPDLPSLTPEQALWIQVLRRLHTDITLGGRSRRTDSEATRCLVQLTEEDQRRLDFVAMAIGLPSDTLSRLVRAGEREYETRERQRERERFHKLRKEVLYV
jgi:hypothetical protein